MFTNPFTRHSFGYGVSSTSASQASNKSSVNVPWISLIISTTALLIGGFNTSHQLLEILCFDQTAITVHAEYWRLLTGHLVHSSFSHLFWDLLIFVPVTVYLEKKNRQLLITSLLTTLIALNLLLLSPWTEIRFYCGISGLLYGVVSALAALIAQQQWQSNRKEVIGYLPLALLLIKTALETSSEQAIFVSEGWPVYQPAHWLGLVCGLFCMATGHRPFNKLKRKVSQSSQNSSKVEGRMRGARCELRIED